MPIRLETYKHLSKYLQKQILFIVLLLEGQLFNLRPGNFKLLSTIRATSVALVATSTLWSLITLVPWPVVATIVLKISSFNVIVKENLDRIKKSSSRKTFCTWHIEQHWCHGGSKELTSYSFCFILEGHRACAPQEVVLGANIGTWNNLTWQQ
jgi:hypothetical protein